MITCECGFKFSGPGEFRNCEAFIDSQGNSRIICPKCGNCYVKYREWRRVVEKESEGGK